LLCSASAFAVVVAPLVVIPEGNLLWPLAVAIAAAVAIAPLVVIPEGNLLWPLL
jgi:galactitol-specific phosphotransferase system IIC component